MANRFPAGPCPLNGKMCRSAWKRKLIIPAATWRESYRLASDYLAQVTEAVPMAGLDKDYPNRARKPVDAPFPPYNGNFPPEQHKYGPFKPMLDAQAAPAAPVR